MGGGEVLIYVEPDLEWVDFSIIVAESLPLGTFSNLRASDPALAKVEVVGEVVKGRLLMLEASAAEGFRAPSSSAMLEESEDVVAAEKS